MSNPFLERLGFLRNVDPFPKIAASLSKMPDEFTLPTILEAAQSIGVDGGDFLGAVNHAVFDGLLDRLYEDKSTTPPTPIAEDEVVRRLRASEESPEGAAAWAEWGGRVRVFWRKTHPCPYNSPDHLNDLDCPACAEAAKRAGTDS